ncbi:hypothetical protein PTSG_05952 [Salpingoeca rosetta]|uniref:Trafficking protein particle complex subunit n=1 Tax=Salpingoeca rosetta (strain ATCC 50818 / BSB-021) TaxID=946362 RepID=F2UD92_SALR5|nr:uncharacterized protein PTSG_05952 [Salpingoeca rosetta]EGD74587.1 hypothetical protein PTSG_05952 [Salpingoeca rosetta]|eukprot:XP_004992844.1 hypothetical protein PTSG_05952 [Salpingoeca rosetta]
MMSLRSAADTEFCAPVAKQQQQQQRPKTTAASTTTTMGIYSVYVINKAGSLLFSGDYAPIPSMDANSRLRLAGLLHGLTTFAGKLSPVDDQSGIEEIEGDGFRLERFQPLSGMQFVVLCDTQQGPLKPFLRKCHRLYADFVLKNPFYSIDMPIRCELFDTHLKAAVEEINRS